MPNNNTITAIGQKEGYIPSLDGLRAISIIIVLFSHLGFKSFIPGVFGVTVFFFVSGYLITGVLLREFDKEGINLRRFYIRRFLRLYPALLVAVIFGSAAYIMSGGLIFYADIQSSLLYYANIHEILGGFSETQIHPYSYNPLIVLWSLAVEEHFYFLFPMIIVVIGNNRASLIMTIATLIIIVTLWRIHVATGIGLNNNRIEHGTDTRFDSILFGCLLAALMRSPYQQQVSNLLRTVWFPVAGALLLLAAFVIRDPWFRETIRFSLQGIGLFATIGALLFSPRWTMIRTGLSTRVATMIGRLSYSLYLWHAVVIGVVMNRLPPVWAGPLGGNVGLLSNLKWAVLVMLPMMMVSFGLAYLSYRFIELPVTNLRRRFGSDVANTVNPG
jgi:peptidoglycan/LPS O-acetylase OafA/YrhL